MTLIEVLDRFTTEINEQIESIEYIGENDYEITVCFIGEDGTTYQKASIALFENGETMLNIRGDNVDVSPVWVWDEVVDFYVEVRNIWKNVV